MAFVDEITLYAEAGRGGDGVVRWRSLHGQPKAGPAGGDGGRGGDVYIEAVADIARLAKYQGNPHFKAGDGEPGGSRGLKGASGASVTIALPVGSVVRVEATGEEYELTEVGQRFLVLKGGAGGYGNEHFKSSRNVAPKQSTPGKMGEKSALHVELRLFADVGLIGLPNAGKTTLLNALTGAKGKVGNYPFTTLDPNIGALGPYILADIPGLIEGASEGKGLGDKFLRHIMRTKTLIHCISVDRERPEAAYEVVRKELEAYHPALPAKPELVVLTKTDLLSPEEVEKKRQALQTHLNKEVWTVSTTPSDLAAFRTKLLDYLQNH